MNFFKTDSETNSSLVDIYGKVIPINSSLEKDMLKFRKINLSVYKPYIETKILDYILYSILHPDVITEELGEEYQNNFLYKNDMNYTEIIDLLIFITITYMKDKLQEKDIELPGSLTDGLENPMQSNIDSINNDFLLKLEYKVKTNYELYCPHGFKQSPTKCYLYLLYSNKIEFCLFICLFILYGLQNNNIQQINTLFPNLVLGIFQLFFKIPILNFPKIKNDFINEASKILNSLKINYLIDLFGFTSMHFDNLGALLNIEFIDYSLNYSLNSLLYASKILYLTMSNSKKINAILSTYSEIDKKWCLYLKRALKSKFCLLTYSGYLDDCSDGKINLLFDKNKIIFKFLIHSYYRITDEKYDTFGPSLENKFTDDPYIFYNDISLEFYVSRIIDIIKTDTNSEKLINLPD